MRRTDSCVPEKYRSNVDIRHYRVGSVADRYITLQEPPSSCESNEVIGQAATYVIPIQFLDHDANAINTCEVVVLGVCEWGAEHYD